MWFINDVLKIVDLLLKDLFLTTNVNNFANYIWTIREYHCYNSFLG